MINECIVIIILAIYTYYSVNKGQTSSWNAFLVFGELGLLYVSIIMNFMFMVKYNEEYNICFNDKIAVNEEN